MSIRTALNTAIHFVNVNSPVILSGVAIIGVGATVYLTYRGTKSAEKKIQQNIFEHCQPGEDGNSEDPDFYDPDLRTKIRLTWNDYIPPVLAASSSSRKTRTSSQVTPFHQISSWMGRAIFALTS